MIPKPKYEQGFSLVELLTVMCIMLLLAGLSLPAMQGAYSTYNRKSAVYLITSAIEQARVYALQSGENTYVILALAQDAGTSPDALIVVGDPPMGSSNTGIVQYTHWIRLPQNVRFRSSSKTLVVNLLSNQSKVTTSMLPPIAGNPTYGYFAFDSTGALTSPSSGGLDVALYEGVRNSHGGETARGPSAKATLSLSDSGIYDVIRLNRYSGRSWAGVSNLLQK